MAPPQATGRPPPRPSDGGEAHPAAAQPPAPRPSAARHTTVDAGGVRCGGVSTARLPTPPPARVAPPLPRTTTTGSGVGAPPAAPATTGTGGACARTMVGAGGGGRRAACKRVSGERPAPRDGKAGPATRGSGWRLRRRVALPASAGADISVGTLWRGGVVPGARELCRAPRTPAPHLSCAPCKRHRGPRPFGAFYWSNERAGPGAWHRREDTIRSQERRPVYYYIYLVAWARKRSRHSLDLHDAHQLFIGILV